MIASACERARPAIYARGAMMNLIGSRRPAVAAGSVPSNLHTIIRREAAAAATRAESIWPL
jgi:hypothetical protein